MSHISQKKTASGQLNNTIEILIKTIAVCRLK